MTTSAPVPQLLTMEELAETLGVTRRHIRRLVDERRVPFLRVGKFIRFDPAEILGGSTPTASLDPPNSREGQGSISYR